jgi:hypothetical protein
MVDRYVRAMAPAEDLEWLIVHDHDGLLPTEGPPIGS